MGAHSALPRERHDYSRTVRGRRKRRSGTRERRQWKCDAACTLLQAAKKTARRAIDRKRVPARESFLRLERGIPRNAPATSNRDEFHFSVFSPWRKVPENVMHNIDGESYYTRLIDSSELIPTCDVRFSARNSWRRRVIKNDRRHRDKTYTRDDYVGKVTKMAKFLEKIDHARAIKYRTPSAQQLQRRAESNGSRRSPLPIFEGDGMP